MTQFTKGKVSDIPTRAGVRGLNLSQALRELEGDDALLVPAKENETPAATQRRISPLLTYAGHGKYSARIDHDRNGVWVFLRHNGAA